MRHPDLGRAPAEGYGGEAGKRSGLDEKEKFFTLEAGGEPEATGIVLREKKKRRPWDNLKNSVKKEVLGSSRNGGTSD